MSARVLHFRASGRVDLLFKVVEVSVVLALVMVWVEDAVEATEVVTVVAAEEAEELPVPV